MNARRIARGVALAMALATTISACTGRPTFTGTTWTVMSVGSTDLTNREAVLQLDPDNKGALAIPCGRVPLVWQHDTDGTAMGFGDANLPASCQPPTRDDLLLLDALFAVDRWSVEGTDRVDLVPLVGEERVRLKRR